MGFRSKICKRRSGEEKVAFYLDYLENGLEHLYNLNHEEFRSPVHLMSYLNKGCKTCYLNSFHGITKKQKIGGNLKKNREVSKLNKGSKSYPFICSEEELFELKDVSNRYSYDEVKKEGVFYKRTYTDLELIAIEKQKKDYPNG
jgi:hypothetical protein